MKIDEVLKSFLNNAKAKECLYAKLPGTHQVAKWSKPSRIQIFSVDAFPGAREKEMGNVKWY